MRLLIALNQCINASSAAAAADDFSSRGYAEVQRTGLETLNKLLMNAGHSSAFGWSMIFDMIVERLRRRASRLRRCGWRRDHHGR